MIYSLTPHILTILPAIVFVTTIFLNLVRKNAVAVWLYAAQSAAVTTLLVVLSRGDAEASALILVFAILATLTVKVFVAPGFLLRLIKRHELNFSSSTYFSLPVTIIILAGLVWVARTSLFAPLASLDASGERFLALSIASIFVSLFLVVNRKGALSQILGILSAENSILAFVLSAGLQRNISLEVGITFDICIWVVIATIFASMIYRQFGSMDVTTMKHLTD